VLPFASWICIVDNQPYTNNWFCEADGFEVCVILKCNLLPKFAAIGRRCHNSCIFYATVLLEEVWTKHIHKTVQYMYFGDCIIQIELYPFAKTKSAGVFHPRVGKQ